MSRQGSGSAELHLRVMQTWGAASERPLLGPSVPGSHLTVQTEGHSWS